MTTFKFSNCTESEIEAIAGDFAHVATQGHMITLSGDLGAGKTLFCRAFIRQFLGVDDLEVPSPTYLISIEHDAVDKPAVNHLDLYRVSDPTELDELGIDEFLDKGVVLIEWPEKAGNALPNLRIKLEIDIVDEFTRNLTLNAPEYLASLYYRSWQIGKFLRDNTTGRYDRKPFPADASARNYELISSEGECSILMDAPSAPDGPPVKNGLPYSRIAHLAEEVNSFVAVARLLRDKKLYAPEIFAEDCENGLVLLEYLGSDGIITPDRNPIEERYIASGGLLASLHSDASVSTKPANTGSGPQIPPFDQSAMLIEVELLTDWYLTDDQYSGTSDDIEEFKQIWKTYATMAQTFRQSIVLRDYHSPNIIWRNNKSGFDRIGLIDFQDALIGPAVYDLVSLAQDGRIIVSSQLENQIIGHYLDRLEANGIQINKEQFGFEYALMGAQRASKLLGIFVRLHTRDGKPEYRKLIPSIRNYLKKNLQHPDLHEYRKWCERVIKL